MVLPSNPYCVTVLITKASHYNSLIIHRAVSTFVRIVNILCTFGNVHYSWSSCSLHKVNQFSHKSFFLFLQLTLQSCLWAVGGGKPENLASKPGSCCCNETYIKDPERSSSLNRAECRIQSKNQTQCQIKLGNAKRIQNFLQCVSQVTHVEM